ncbi:histidine phosphatase family protein [Herbiconiux moechotypicola]|uniref:Histidine phosphatase family protein n=1 Tax=Herbiconiux moechotypicola TaxID=637393 RepID=A0ABN3E134_9MICO|nr:histidine phosphatase family protein [Herbiconiux moechotypicola]MCS5731278.1 histidine phosphatase family protein [Herbiconiux moechotypicola]
MTTFTFVRHGQTDWNFEKRIQGTTDVPLNDTGREQARETGLLLAERQRAEATWNGIVASPLSRARETAEIIASIVGFDDVELVPAIAERSYGEVEGLNAEELRARFPDPLAPVPGRERRRHVVARVLPALELLAEEHPGESLIVVSHGGVIGSLIRYVTDKALPGQGQFIPNGSAHDFVIDDGHLSLSEFNGEAIDPAIRRRAPLAIELTLPS